MRSEDQIFELTEEQESRIRCAVASSDCRVIITRKESRAYKLEQDLAKAAVRVPLKQIEEESKQAMTERRERPD